MVPTKSLYQARLASILGANYRHLILQEVQSVFKGQRPRRALNLIENPDRTAKEYASERAVTSAPSAAPFKGLSECIS